MYVSLFYKPFFFADRFKLTHERFRFISQLCLLIRQKVFGAAH